MSVESHDLGDVASLAALAGYGDSYVVPGDEVYVVPEDTDYVYRNPGTNPVADGFNIIKAIFLPGYWERRGGSSGGAGLRFNTVALGASGSGRLIDVGLSGLVDGVSTAWVESVKDTWRWDATSTLTADNITVANPTANGVNPGRFIRELIAAPEWLQQAAWFVDTAGNDENDGSTALTPVKTDVEIGRRWGLSAILSVPVTVTYAQSPATVTNYDVQALAGGSLTLVAPRTVDQTVVIAAVTPQDRATQTPLAINAVGLGAGDVGKIAIISASGTPANVGAYAGILRDLGGGTVEVSKFGTFTPSAPFTEVTPTVGDTVQVCTLVVLTFGTLRFRSKLQAAAAASPTRNCFVIDSLRLNGANLGSLYSEALINVFLARSIVTTANFAGDNLGQFHVCGGILVSASFNPGPFIRLRKPGILNGGFNNNGASLQVDTDTYFENSFFIAGRGSASNTQGAAFFNRTSANQAMVIFGGGTVVHTGTVADWGTGNAGFGLLIRSNGTYTYVTKPNINGGLGAGRESSIGGVDTQYAAYPATGAVNLTNFASATLFA